ncbi:MAG: hypothetical protein IJA69_06315, partial [Clostridia bacterium]|nr:hypothetical protein [Clostridia bacterium]
MIYKRKSNAFICYILTVCLILCCMIFSPAPKPEKTWQDFAQTNFEVGIEKDNNGENVLVNYISTPEQLAGAFKLASAKDSVLADDISTITGANASSTRYVLKNSIDLRGKAWTPTEFKGSLFDGGFNTISNLTIATSSGTEIGFISSTSATIKNVVFSNISISYNKANTGVTIGGVVAKLNSGGKIENVMVTGGSVSCAKATQTTSRTMGGIVGRASGSQIYNCTNKASLTNGGHMGGIVGVFTESATISNCFNYGTISAGSFAPFRVGGIIGEASNSAGSISLCYNKGLVSVTASNDSDIAVGGIVGYCYVGISQCANEANITGGNSSISSVRCGGIVGYTEGSISNCYNTGDIYADAKQNDVTTTVSADVSSTSLGGYTWTTGILWWKESHSYTYYYSYDNVSAVANKRTAYAGGIVGYCTTSISNCYSEATVSGGYEFNKTVSTFKIWANNDGTTSPSNETKLTNTNIRLLSSPICGNIDNTNVSNVYYSGIAQTSSTILDLVWNNNDDLVYSLTEGSTSLNWTANGADLEEGNVSNV